MKRDKRAGPVLHVVSSGGLYGIERMLLTLLPELQRQGCPVALLCLDGPEAEVLAAARDAGVPTLAVECTQRVTPRGWVDLLRAIGAQTPRIVHVHGYKASILAGAAGLVRRVPTVATYHGVAAKAGETSRALARYLAVETPILRRFRAIAAVSDQIADELIARRVRPERVRVIANGIVQPALDVAGASLERADPKFRPCLLALSRLAPEKNIHVLLRAVAALRAEFPQLGVVVAGDGQLRGELEALASSLGIRDAVEFAGFVRDVPRLYERCDVFVLASQTEGMPMSLLEAMALGLPIVASRVGGIPFMVQDGVEGLLVEPGDSHQLAQALHRVLSEERTRNRLGEAAHRKFKREFTAPRMAESYRLLYDEVAPA